MSEKTLGLFCKVLDGGAIAGEGEEGVLASKTVTVLQCPRHGPWRERMSTMNSIDTHQLTVYRVPCGSRRALRCFYVHLSTKWTENSGTRMLWQPEVAHAQYVQLGCHCTDSGRPVEGSRLPATLTVIRIRADFGRVCVFSALAHVNVCSLFLG